MTTYRKTWDKDEYAKRAKERLTTEDGEKDNTFPVMIWLIEHSIRTRVAWQAIFDSPAVYLIR